jgi:phosphatidylglycerophosphatase A
VIDAAIRWVALGFGAGRSPVAPGTVGTAVGVPLAWGASLIPGVFLAPLLLLSLPLCAWVCDRAAKTGIDGRGCEKDPGWIVLDEIVGYLVATAWVEPSWAAYGAAFLLFRLFDILKPFPVGWLDRNVDGGWGILLDDVAAGLMARAALWGLAVVGVV